MALEDKEWSQDWIDTVRRCANTKWANIAAGVEEDKGGVNCELCQKAGPDGCDCCPVFYKTGSEECIGTPYEDWANYFKSQKYYYVPKQVISKASCNLAEAEMRFLLNLADEMERLNKPKYYLKIENPEVAIGEGTIFVRIVGKDGQGVAQPYVVSLNKDRTLHLESCVNADIVTTENDRIKIAQ